MNPFSAYGTIASGDRFVGRDRECGYLRERLYEAGSSAALIGLSRMGKSSIAARVLDMAPDPSWITGRVNVATATSGHVVLQEIQVTLAAGDEVPQSEDVHAAYRQLRAALLRVRSAGGRVVMVLDEFDAVRGFPDARAFLNILRELVYDPSRLPMAVLAVARRSIDRIEIEAADISTFAGVCDSLYLGPMIRAEIDSMAARCADLPAGSSLVAWDHSGGQPFLSELILSRIFGNGIADIAEHISGDLTSYFVKVREFLEKERLWFALVQLTLGPVLDVRLEERTLLDRYGLLGRNGYALPEDFVAYLRFSALELDAWGIFGVAERAVRELVTAVLAGKYGPDWLDLLSARHKQVARIVAESGKRRAQDARKFPTAAKQPLLDYSYPGDLWDLMAAEWHSFALLEPRKGKEFWRTRLVSLSEIRAPLAHHRDDVVPDQKKALAGMYCRELAEVVTEYLDRRAEWPAESQAAEA
jgi:hypothetical protein